MKVNAIGLAKGVMNAEFLKSCNAGRRADVHSMRRKGIF